LDRQATFRARSFAEASAGSSIAARTATIATTTNNSTSVKAPRLEGERVVGIAQAKV
jgi:hypothetical protein